MVDSPKKHQPLLEVKDKTLLRKSVTFRKREKGLNAKMKKSSKRASNTKATKSHSLILSE